MRFRPKSFRLWPKSCRFRTKSLRSRPTFQRLWQIFCTYRPKSLKFLPKGLKVRPKYSWFWQKFFLRHLLILIFQPKSFKKQHLRDFDQNLWISIKVLEILTKIFDHHPCFFSFDYLLSNIFLCLSFKKLVKVDSPTSKS